MDRSAAPAVEAAATEEVAEQEIEPVAVSDFTPDTKTCPEKSTPGTVFNEVVVKPMHPFYFRLEAADNVSRHWTMQFASETTGEQLGLLRMNLKARSDFLIPSGWKQRGECKYTALDATFPYETGDYYWPWGKDFDLALLGYKNHVTLVSACYTPNWQ
jgi:hypothetical protein